MNPSNPEDLAAAKESLAGDSLKKVREILFGEDQRAFDDRLKTLGDNVRQEFSRLRDSMSRDVQSLRSHVDETEKDLRSDLQEERNQRAGSAQNLSARLDALGKESSEALTELGNKLTEELQTLRRDLTEHIDKVSRDIESKVTDLSARTDTHFQKMREETVSKARLVTFLQRAITELNGHPEPESGPPGSAPDQE